MLIEGGMKAACDVIQYACSLAHDSCSTKEDDKKGVIEVTKTDLVEVTATKSFQQVCLY